MSGRYLHPATCTCDRCNSGIAIRAASRDEQRRETCTCCGIRAAHTISCDVGNGVAPDDEAIRRAWLNAGGSFHGPNVETGTMPEAQLLPLLRSLMVKA
jgi:hypothetical protein